MNFNITNQLLIRYSVYIRYWRKYGSTVTVDQLFIDSEKAQGQKYCTTFSLNLLYLLNYAN
jgi:hypothetical protein